jgi:exodeoxyribonuclease VIII
MVDIETMDVVPTAAIVSIGAVKFDTNTGELGETFKVNLDITEQKKLGLSFSNSTVEWWKEQPPEVWKGIRENSVSITEGMERFKNFCGKSEFYWGNGAGFDMPIIRNACHVIGMEPWWKYYNLMCYRTLINLHGLDNKKLSAGREGYHDSVSDAIFQAETLLKIMKGEL